MLSSNLGQIMLGIGAASGVAIVAIVVIPPPSKVDYGQPTEPVVALVEPAQPDVVVIADTPATIPETAPETAPPILNPPAIDTLRVEPSGSVLIAGRAEPRIEIALIVAGEEVARTTSDATGGFVAFVDLEPSDQTRALSLLADPDGSALASEASYFIAPIQSDPEPVEPTTAIVPDETVPEPAAPAVIVADAEGVRVVQSPDTSTAPEVLATVALDTITYDASGDVLLGGRAAGDGFVRVYLDNQPITTSRIKAGGNWRTDLPDIDTGVYTLRVDEVDSGGAVVSRIETPFKREEPQIIAEALAEQTAQPEFQVAMTTVQPGATLWAIAQERFGDGIMYVSVFEANRDRIKNPDLIYPGQVFRVPDAGN